MSEWAAFQHKKHINKTYFLFKNLGSIAEYPLATNTDWSLIKNHYHLSCAIAAGIETAHAIFKRKYTEPPKFDEDWLNSNFTENEIDLIKLDYTSMIAKL